MLRDLIRVAIRVIYLPSRGLKLNLAALLQSSLRNGGLGFGGGFWASEWP